MDPGNCDKQNNIFNNNGVTTKGLSLQAGCLKAKGVTIYYNAVSDKLDRLPFFKDAILNSSKLENEAICMEGTRQEVLSEIYHWADGEHEQSVLWLSGWAKVGKSTIARTVAKECDKRERLGGSFFFAEGNEQRDSMGGFVGTMAHQLLEINKSYGDSLQSILRQSPMLPDYSLTKQWDRLIWKPLVKSHESQGMPPTVLVIDALDECKEDITSILEIFCKTHSRHIRLLITSRPATYDQFCQIKGECQSIILHDVKQETVNNDLRSLFKKSIPAVIFDSFDAELLLGKLVERAGGLFVVATALTRYLKCESLIVRDRVVAILTGNTMRVPPDSILDSVYCNALEKSIPDNLYENDRKNHCDSIKQVLGGIAIMFTEISVNSFYNLLNIREQASTLDREIIHSSLGTLSAILIVPQKASDKKRSFRLHHSALCDFLFDTSRCNMYFSVDRKEAHLTILKCCIRVLNEQLSQYLGCLKVPERSLGTANGRVVEQCPVDEIQYACIYWVKHLEGSNLRLCDNDIIHTFLRSHVLDWLEASCRITMVDDVLEAINLLGKSKRGPSSRKVHGFIEDIRQFALKNQQLLKEDPSHIHESAIIFAPLNSPLRQEFGKSALKRIKYLPETRYDWDPEIVAFEHYLHNIRELVCTRHNVVVSRSDNGVVKLWNAVTGRFLHALDGVSVDAISLSNDGKLLACLSKGFLSIWNTVTGVRLSTYQASTQFAAIAFTEDSNTLLTACHASIVQYLNFTTGQCTPVLNGHIDSGKSITMSADATTILSWGQGKEITVWKIQDSRCHYKFSITDEEAVQTVSISGNGIRLASAGEGIRVWDLPTRECWCYISERFNPVTSLGMSPDGQFLAAGYDNASIQIWNLDTGQPLQVLKGHYGPVVALTFSLEDFVLVSGSGDWTVRTWKLGQAQPAAFDTSKERGRQITALQLSSDGSILATGTLDGTISLWKTERGERYANFSGHRHEVESFYFIEDNLTLISTSADRTIRLWNAATRDSLKNLTGHTSPINTSQISEDGNLLATASLDHTIMFFTGHGGRVQQVAFSTDGTVVASASADGNIRLWRTTDGASMGPLMGNGAQINGIAFRANTMILASCAADGTVRLWDVLINKCIRSLEGGDPQMCVAVSSDHGLIASAAMGVVKIWHPSQETPSERSVAIQVSNIALGTVDLNLQTFDTRPSSQASNGLERLLWIPRGYQYIERSICRQNIVALGYKSGEVLILYAVKTVAETGVDVL
ncbi:WD40 repeat-like protein [Aspergillus taichungensis]|uniref:Mitochondrial division protein 1 n=1 Tax=Aspergillus taichungensis TaxID=482145 RepID=A0A2J5HV67_9EURO|nr:WD40 repeat-like protein [Aspergillus taichungensis]